MKGRRGVYLVAAVFAVAGFLVVTGSAAAGRQVHATSATNVACGDTLTASVTMNGDLDCSGYSTGAAVTIGADGVTLDLGGHTIVGNSGEDVVYSDGYNDWAVQNGAISGGEEQVYDQSSSDATIQNLTMTGASDDCIDTYYAAGTAISNITCSGAASYGWYSEYSGGVSLTGSVFTNDDYGVYVDEDIADSVSSNYFRQNVDNGIYDEYSDLQSYSGNIVTGNSGDGVYIYADTYGIVNLVSNASRVNGGWGFDVYEAYSNERYESPWSTVSGNLATYNTDGGFYDDFSINATWSNNTAVRNSSYGFNLDYPTGDTITGNAAKYNADSGFYLEDNYAEYNALSFANNSAMYNQDYGFYADYGQPGSGNVGGGTNSPTDCYQVAGCS